MEAEVFVAEVEETTTRSGNTRFVLRDRDGREYSTFRPAIGKQAARFRGQRARIEFHEEDRGGFHNVYLDAIAPAAAPSRPADEGTDPDETAWSTAVDAAPWLLGTREPRTPSIPTSSTSGSSRSSAASPRTSAAQARMTATTGASSASTARSPSLGARYAQVARTVSRRTRTSCELPPCCRPCARSTPAAPCFKNPLAASGSAHTRPASAFLTMAVRCQQRGAKDGKTAA
jgi:hypothetical protein